MVMQVRMKAKGEGGGRERGIGRKRGVSKRMYIEIE